MFNADRNKTPCNKKSIGRYGYSYKQEQFRYAQQTVVEE
jgi:hypothetical protein